MTVTIPPVPGALIGREQEIDQLDGWLGGCLQGQGRAVLIEGEAGIGKSTLVRAACELAAEAGFVVFRGAGDELGQALPLLPFLDALEVRESATDPRRRAVLRLLRGELAAGSPVDVVTASSEQLFALVEELSTEGPALLVIDDLQWADAATVALWGRLARAARQLPFPVPLLLLGVARPTPQRDGLRALRRSVDVADVVRLGPLAEPAVRTLLTTLTGARPGAALSRLADGAAGNPLYLTELVGALSRGERLAETEPGTVDVTAGPAPDTLSAAIADRLGFLDEPVRAVLKAAALLGVRFAVDDLGVILRRSVGELLPAFDNAIAAGVLTESPDGFGFRHPLIRTALYDELPASVRAAWHRDAGRALAAAGAPVARVARQLLSADAPAGPNVGPLERWVLDWLVGAGPTLIAQAPQAAADLLRRAAVSWPDRGTHDVLGVLLADALYRVGSTAEAEAVATAALDRVTAPDLLVELHWILAQAQAQSGRSTESLAALDKALAGPGLTTKHRARLLVMVARAHRTVGQVELAGKAAEQALADATESGDRWSIGWALHALSIVTVMRGETAAAVPLFDRALAVTADELSLTDLRLLLQINYAVTLGDLDRYPEALEAAHEVRDAASRIGSVVRMVQAQTALGELLFDTGRWDDALTAVNALPEDLKDPGVACCDYGLAASVHLHRGTVDDARRYLELAAPHAEVIGDRVVASLAMARAVFAEQEGRPEDALAVLTGSLGENAEELDEMEDLLPDAVRLALECGDKETAAAVVRQAEAVRDGSDLPHRDAAALYCRGMLAEDPQLLLQAAERYLAIGRPLPRAAALEAAAARFAHLGDRAAARAAFSRALDGYNALGANWDAARLQAQFREYGIRRAPRVKHATARHGWDSLTPTEAKIADLVVLGRSNPQIAAQLYLSPRTVGTHVSHILSKLDLHSRIDLAREAARRTDAVGEA